MNCYLFFVFMTLCFGRWATARDVYHCPRGNSLEPTEETKKRLNGDGGSTVINGLVRVASQARTWTLWLRRLLKALRKWCNSHPPEVKLGKCFASYFNIKIPGLRRNGKIARYNEDLYERREHFPKILKISREDCCPSQRSIIGETLLEKKIIFILQDFLTGIVNSFRHYRDVIFKNDIVVCVWDYFWKKFWNWVDTAPDSRRL